MQLSTGFPVLSEGVTTPGFLKRLYLENWRFLLGTAAIFERPIKEEINVQENSMYCLGAIQYL